VAGEASSASNDVKVVFLLGFPRSGSTLVGNILGQLDGWFYTGELRELWRRRQLERARCGCGRPAGTCPVWQSVVQEAATGRPGHGYDDREVVALQGRALRWGGMRLALARRRPQAGREPSCDAYLETLTETYRSIAKVTGARVVVDSSKWPADGAMAEFAARVQPWFVHLVRDPRGVVHSRQRARERRLQSHQHPRPVLAGLRPLWLAYDAVGWATLNLAARHAPWRPAPPRWIDLAYEDLVQHPEETLALLLEQLGEGGSSMPFVGPATVYLAENHAVAGNRNRLDSGEVRVTADESWRGGLAPWEQRLVWVLSRPGRRAGSSATIR
jgi:hypothetical protein